MNNNQLRKRMTENYSYIIKKMTNAERAWAEYFESMEYAIERGHARDAIKIAKQLNINVSETVIQRIRDDVEAKDRCNPDRANRVTRKHNKSRKTDQRRISNMYDASDWIRQKFKVDPKTDKAYEVALTSNPEDALIEALDAAAVHGVSLEGFLNDPKYHTPERRAGRPKKVKE
jgi:hypothetical protein